MKKVLLIMLLLVIILSCISFTACTCGKESDIISAITNAQGQTPTQQQTPAKTTAKTTDSSGDGGSWGNIPIYPGSKKIISMKSDDNENIDGEPAIIEHRTYTTDSDTNDVADFYKDKMPANGWDETAWMEVSTGFMGSYERNSGKEILGITMAPDSEGGTVYNIDWKYLK